MSSSKTLLSILVLVFSVQSYAYPDIETAYKQLQLKIEETISQNRQFYSCDSDFGKPSIYYQGSQTNKWFSINIAAVTTPLANMNLVNEISTATADNMHFQAAYKKVFPARERNYLVPGLASGDTETITYIFSASLGEKPTIQHSYKKGTFDYYTFMAKGNCTVLNAQQFADAMAKRIGQ